MRLSRFLLLGLGLASITACGSSTPAPEPAPPVRTAPPSSSSPPPPGPTRTEFRVIARQLVARCTGGGWIEGWRSEHVDVLVAKPRILFEGIEDTTDEGLDTVYLGSMLEGRMQRSGVYDMVTDPEAVDFLARARIARMVERSRGGVRFPVYMTSLEIVDPGSGRTVRRCEAVIEGEL